MFVFGNLLIVIFMFYVLFCIIFYTAKKIHANPYNIIIKCAVGLCQSALHNGVWGPLGPHDTWGKHRIEEVSKMISGPTRSVTVLGLEEAPCAECAGTHSPELISPHWQWCLWGYRNPWHSRAWTAISILSRGWWTCPNEAFVRRKCGKPGREAYFPAFQVFWLRAVPGR